MGLKQKMTNWFFIENSSGLVLDIAGGKQGGELQIYTKHGGDNQLWSRDEEGRLVSKTGLACDIEGGQKKEGTKVIGWSQHEGQNQKWKLSGNHIYSLLNNLVLDVKGGKTSSGSKVHMWPWHGGINQRWYITPLEQKMTNWFFIENSSTSSRYRWGKTRRRTSDIHKTWWRQPALVTGRRRKTGEQDWIGLRHRRRKEEKRDKSHWMEST